MDWSLLHSLNDFMAGHDGVEDPLLFYVEISEALFLSTLVVVFLLARAAAHAAWRRATVAAALSAGVALAIGKVISEIVDRSRPFVVDPHGVHLFSPHAPDPGFPSDHATAAFAIAVAILLRKRGWGVFALAAAAVLSIGRVALGVHFPSDVLAGAALGSLAAIALGWRPLRTRIDALADLLGRPWDGLLDRAGQLVGWRRGT
ncbi:MAG TPA: phosphatase PAP2 family protein [Solirubrobacterales bacterium]|nr:phosphatase PAP2 family protein [Solirubrobacterales bacterium]